MGLPKISHPAGRRASQSGEARKAPKGLGQGTVGGGELVHRAAGGAEPQAVADGSSPSRFPKFARSAQPRTLCFSASLLLCVKNQSRTFSLWDCEIMGMHHYENMELAATHFHNPIIP